MPIRATRTAHRRRVWWSTPPQRPPWHTRSGCWDIWRHCDTSSTEQTDCWLSCLELRETQVFRWDKLHVCKMINVHSVLIRFKTTGAVAVWCTPKQQHKLPSKSTPLTQNKCAFFTKAVVATNLVNGCVIIITWCSWYFVPCFTCIFLCSLIAILTRKSFSSLQNLLNICHHYSLDIL